MRLYEITAEYEKLLDLIEAGEIPEEAIADTLESIEAVLEDKADNIACMIKSLNAEIKAISEERASLYARQIRKQKTVDKMKEYLTDNLTKAGISKMETARNKLSFRKSEKVVIDDPEAFTEWAKAERGDLLTYKEPEISKTAIKTAIGDGEYIEGVRLETYNNLQIK